MKHSEVHANPAVARARLWRHNSMHRNCCAVHWNVLRGTEVRQERVAQVQEADGSGELFGGDDYADDFHIWDDENLEESTNGTPNRPPNFAYKMKILLGFFQISVGVAFAIEMPWPSDFKDFIALFNIVNLDIVQWTRVGCVVKNTTYLTKHLVVAITPIILGVLVSSAYLLPKIIPLLAAYNRGDEQVKKAQLRLKRSVRKFWKMFLFTLFLIYPQVSSIMVRLYSCRTVEGVTYLNADFNVQCSSAVWFNRALINVFFIVLYPIGILYLFTMILYENKDRLNTPECLIQFGFLYGDYNRDVWWFELIDMTHKLFMTSVLALFPSDIVLQVGLVVLILHAVGIMMMNPYARKGDDRLHLFVQVILFNMFLCGYVYKKTESTDDFTNKANTVILIFMVIAVVTYVVAQVFTVARKLFLIRRRRKARGDDKGHKILDAMAVPELAEQILKKRRDSLKMARNPLFTVGTEMDAIRREEEPPAPEPVKNPAEYLAEEDEKKDERRKPIVRAFAPVQIKRHDDE
eukprot:TRINITY_DN20_c0_g1_i2.p1 TRINITY_DN20_c0_g1~~TRINITY_DN20_c0_g1_i2.p1  ORF type:complete len:520 (-),score=151.83 TRINITY_DN20_c0_g1_i2:130-1689(-)